MQFEILSTRLLAEYNLKVNHTLLQDFEKLADSELSIASFSYYASVAAVYSSKIEGENIELDSYVKHKRFGIEFLPDYTRKIDDLYDGYQFAKRSVCNQINLEYAHE